VTFDLASFFQSKGIKVVAYDRYDSLEITPYITSYTHENIANGGNWTCQIVMSVPIVDVDGWYQNGLNRLIEVYDQASILRWDGRVNKVTVALAGLTFSRGELMNIGNRASTVFTPIDYSVSPAVTGSTTVTAITEDLISQDTYGVLEKVINAGTCPLVDAQRAQAVYLREASYPDNSGDLNISPESGSTAIVTLDCVGVCYYALKSFIYTNTTAGAITLSDKVKDIIDQELWTNMALMGNENGIVTNAYAVAQQEMKNRYAFDVMTAIANLGDASDNRWIFGAYGEMLYYNPIPTTILYEYSTVDERQRIFELPSRVEIFPWEVKAGFWLQNTDFLAGSSPKANVYEEPRNIFIESVQYTAPWTLSITGERQKKNSQLLMKLTNSGGA
jgi:hypothetical protein